MAVTGGPGARAARRLDAAGGARARRGAGASRRARPCTRTKSASTQARLDARPARRSCCKDGIVTQADVDSAKADVDSTDARIAALQRAGQRRRAADRAAADRSRQHDHPRAVQRRRDLEGRAAGRDGLAGVGRRRLHAHRHLHDRRHALARDRGRRQRELHQPRDARHRTSRRCSTRIPDWQIPGARDHDRADGRSAEGDGARAHRLREARSAHPARHGREGDVPARGRRRGRRAARRSRRRSCRRPRSRPTATSASCSSSRATPSSGAPSRVGGTDGDRVEVLAGLHAGDRVVLIAAAGL